MFGTGVGAGYDSHSTISATSSKLTEPTVSSRARLVMQGRRTKKCVKTSREASENTVRPEGTRRNFIRPAAVHHCRKGSRLRPFDYRTEWSNSGSDIQYLATIPIGTPQRNFNIIVDSGSGVFWVGSNICKFDGGGPCGHHTYLSEKESSTFVNSKIPWHATYGSGNASGEVVRDNVIVAGMQLTNFCFGVANVLSSEFTTDGNIDGLMGLARSSITSLKLPTPVEEMARRGLIPAAITSYRLPRRTDSINDGEISFGGLDESRINASELITVPSADPGFWIAEMGPVTVNGEDIGLTGRSALLDTGTTLMAASADDVQAIHKKIPGAKHSTQGYTVPCNTTAVLALTFGGRSFPINTQELARGSATQRTGDCGSGISGVEEEEDGWIKPPSDRSEMWIFCAVMFGRDPEPKEPKKMGLYIFLRHHP
ncbi:aspartic peptidase domain-containing protein [Mycena pura]|uniref:Aspartic peptidase domain-containing protein n=1 Tax=Mycena pura TaxID=153505 RepID=A0AAD6YKG6_9AGAR|nr:aspartic peptidase domain-containing protein [Mycena pura]